MEEESHEARLPHVLPTSYSWGQKDQERSTAFSDYRGRKRLPSRLSGCITRGRGQEKKPRTEAREAKSSEAQLQGMGVMRQEAGEIRTGGAKGKASELSSKLRSPTMSGYKETDPKLVPALQPLCTCNISKNRGALSNQK